MADKEKSSANICLKLVRKPHRFSRVNSPVDMRCQNESVGKRCCDDIQPGCVH